MRIIIRAMRGRIVTLVRAVQTCYACPSQWDAWDADGTRYYLRFRHGCGSFSRCEADGDTELTWFRHGGPMDGVISLAEFAELAGFRLAEGLA